MRAVIDTNVLFEGLGMRGPCGQVLDRWVDRKFTPCVSTALALEYEEVLTRDKPERQQERMRKVLQALLIRAAFVPVVFSYRPQSPDPEDDMVIDCVMNGRAVLVTSNVRHFRTASRNLGFTTYTPEEFVTALDEGK
jgi:putative PIN family toxin of toxin-antitoxin system